MRPVAFETFITESGHRLERGRATALQVNMGLACNLSCGHCHLSAGPGRKEMMSAGTAIEVARYFRRGGFDSLDITGGAPEMNPNLPGLIEVAAVDAAKIIVRSNLLLLPLRPALVELFRGHRVEITASLPSLSPAQAEAQRGPGFFERFIGAMKYLNGQGYGVEGSGLALNLAVNPVGAFLHSSQSEMETRFRRELARKHGVSFNRLLAFTNVPLGRFGQWLESSGNHAGYLNKLAGLYNRCALEGAMCRYQVSVNWEGYLFDCDFNLAQGLYSGGERIHVSQMENAPEPGAPIAMGDHCYACAAGSGFTCGGAVTG
ncbi:MAG: arsenosugar biosynthesis radical SAM protein ArsS [Nitrospinae bacterium]|nr:arsenosugar biosynthesis radical SAM protein ArsS [Nitrospinota bacterium]